MIRLLVLGIALLVVSVLLAATGCDKEKIVESTQTEYVHDIEYVRLPPDTVFRFDTVYNSDSVTVYAVDTVFRIDTLVQLVEIYDTVNSLDTVSIHDTITNVVHHYDTTVVVDTVVQGGVVYDTTWILDTIVTVQHHFDTVIVVDTIVQGGTVHDTVYVTDTIVTVQHHYDTVYVSDSVVSAQCTPNPFLAYTALQYYSDPMVIEAINAEFGINEGWIFYMSVYQCAIDIQSEEVYDIYGQIDYWTPEWDAFYPFEFYWRVVHISGDPADPRNWELTEPPGYAPTYRPGVNIVTDRAPSLPKLR